MNLKTIYYLLLVIGLSFSFPGCMTLGTVEIEVIKPAKIALPSKVNSLLLINNSLIFPADSFKNGVQKGLFTLDTSTTQLLMYQLNGILNESPRFDTAILISDIYYRSQSNLLQPINWKNVNDLCTTYHADALVSLEAFGIVDSIVRTSNFDGFEYTTYKTLMLIANSLWRIYLANDQQILEKRVRHDTLTILEIDSKKSYLYAIEDPETVNYLANTISQQVSVKVADRMAPYWQPVERDFYIYENSEMRQAASYAYADNWRAAALIWKSLINHNNKKLAAAACFNMALVCEVEGKLKIAEQWLNESLEKYNSDIAHNYMKQIQIRIKESEELDKQFGIKKN